MTKKTISEQYFIDRGISVKYLDAKVEIVKLKNEICVLRLGQRLPILCPKDGEHEWDSVCRKCDMKVLYNPEASIGKDVRIQEYPK